MDSLDVISEDLEVSDFTQEEELLLELAPKMLIICRLLENKHHEVDAGIKPEIHQTAEAMALEVMEYYRKNSK
jgi:hypothetical protein